MVSNQLDLFERPPQERERIWHQLPEESRQRIAELFAALLIDQVAATTEGEVANER